jgi:hypothetical protein
MVSSDPEFLLDPTDSDRNILHSMSVSAIRNDVSASEGKIQALENRLLRLTETTVGHTSFKMNDDDHSTVAATSLSLSSPIRRVRSQLVGPTKVHHTQFLYCIARFRVSNIYIQGLGNTIFSQKL